METVMGIVGGAVGVVLILNGIFMWFPPPPASGDARSAAGRKVIIRAIGVFGALCVIFALKMLGVF